MKYLLFWGLMLPLMAIGQKQDSVYAAKEVDSLIQVCRTLTGQKQYEDALAVIDSACNKAQVAFGVESAGYASCAFNKGRVYYFMGKYAESEVCYLEAKKIREKVLGKEHADYVQSINNLALLYYRIKNYGKSEAFYLEAKSIREKVLGKEHPDYANSLNNLAALYRETMEYKKSERLFLDAIAVEEKVLGRDHASYVGSLNDLAGVYKSMNEYKKAEKLYIEAKTIREKVLGKEHPDYAASLNNLAGLYYRKGDYLKAEQLWLETKIIREKTLGKESPDYASSLNNLSVLYHEMGNFEKAEQLNIEALNIREKTLGKEHQDFVSSLSTLGVLYWSEGYFEKSESLYQEVILIQEQILGKNHPDYATSLNNLAVLYSAMGLYNKSELLHLKAKEIRRNTLGELSPQYAESLNNLATLYLEMGNFVDAENLLLEAKDIQEKMLGNNHSHYATTLDNLGTLYYDMGALEIAEQLYLEAKDIRKKAFGVKHKDYAASLSNLGNIYSEMYQYDKSQIFYAESLAIQKELLSKEHPNYAGNLHNLALLYSKTGNLKKSETLFLEAKKIREKVLGKEHIDYAWSLSNLASLYEKRNKFSASEPLLEELSNIAQVMLSKSINYLSERELAQFSFKFQDWSDNLSAYLLARPSTKRQSSPLPLLDYNNALFQKGFLLNAAARLNLLTSASPESAEINLRLKGYRRRLAKEYAKPISERKGVDELEEKANAAEKELARSVAGYAEAMRQVSWQEVQSALKKGEAAIEFIHFKVNFPAATDSTMYAALVLRPGEPAPLFIPLFEEREIQPLLKGASGKSFSRINALYANDGLSGAGHAKNLYDLIWKPLEQALQGVKTIYYAPSGLLHRINLGAIPMSKGLVSDQYELFTLGSTRRLVIPDSHNFSGQNAQLFGGIRYAADDALLAVASVKPASARDVAAAKLPFRTDSTTRGDSWQYLPETAVEVRDIHQTLNARHWDSQLDTGYRATEEAFRNLGKGQLSPRLLHIATHGFFFPDPKINKGRQLLFEGNAPVFRLSEHPMIRSGLIFAGAQEAWSSGKPPENREDGILTAYEISQMNLSNTELVVLSACETGLGDIEGNEGVYGLQRAFKIAGAKYLIMSLWKVSDLTSRELMTDFYHQWLDLGIAIPDAFHQAQANMRQKYPDAPYHWAGFVLVE